MGSVNKNTEPNSELVEVNPDILWFGRAAECLKDVIETGAHSTKFRIIFVDPILFAQNNRKDGGSLEFLLELRRWIESDEGDKTISGKPNRTTAVRWEVNKKIEGPNNNKPVYISDWSRNSYKNAKTFFNACTVGDKVDIINYYTAVAKRIFTDSAKMATLEKLHDALGNTYPYRPIAYDGSRDKSVANAIYALLLLEAGRVIGYEPVDEALPIGFECDYRESSENSERELKEFGKVVVAFPCNSIERYLALRRLWESKSNYYAGWELAALLYHGANLLSTDEQCSLNVPKDREEAGRICQQLQKLEESNKSDNRKAPVPLRFRCDGGSLSEGEKSSYPPAMLSIYRGDCASASEKKETEIEELLRGLKTIEKFEPYESRMLQFRLYGYVNGGDEQRRELRKKAMNDGDHEHSLEAYEEYVFFDNPIETASLDERIQGALMGSRKCLENILKKPDERVRETCESILNDDPTPEQVELIAETYSGKVSDNSLFSEDVDLVLQLIHRLKILYNFYLNEEFTIRRKIRKIGKNVDDLVNKQNLITGQMDKLRSWCKGHIEEI